MARKLAWLVAVVLVVADMVLVVAALSDGRPSKKPAAPAPVTRNSDTPYPAPEMVAPTRSGGAIRAAAPSPNQALGKSRAPTPSPIQVLGESRAAGPALTAITPPPAAIPVSDSAAAPATGRILLAVNSNGVVVRASRGSCPSGVPTALSVSSDSGTSWGRVDTLAAQVLRVGATESGTIWFVGSDVTCRPVERESGDAGVTWRPGGSHGVWHLGPDAASTNIAGPGLVSDVGCVPVALDNVDARRAAAVCVDGDIRRTDDAGDTWRTVSSFPGAVSLALAGADRGYLLAETDDCRAAVLRTDDAAKTWRPLACLGNAAPRAIAAAGEFAAAQIGPELLISRDTGVHWRRASE